MNPSRSARSLFIVGLAIAVQGCSSEKPSDQAAAPATEPGAETVPLMSAPKPFFLPAGTGPAVWGPGDLYTLLVTGAQTNNAYFQFEALVPPGGGPPPHLHGKRTRRSIWCRERWRCSSAMRSSWPSRAIS